jgi:hypothetical protein
MLKGKDQKAERRGTNHKEGRQVKNAEERAKTREAHKEEEIKDQRVESRQQKAGSRKQAAESRQQKAGSKAGSRLHFAGAEAKHGIRTCYNT